ncbi:hypothetical protein CHS0354_040542 [Potamilus streckersoni]|uniref:Protein kinase domain-containing protein n=1 Tax=Potamilus streckersoni TaxID=2493646 RepID=A0AAE0W6X5_9BIVA|nr:hypothetical protein CHS0354_040542 [Potamilus streckersoni]
MKKRLVSWMEDELYEVHKKKEDERRREAKEIRIKNAKRKKEEEIRKRKEEEKRLHREEEERCKRVELQNAIDVKEVPKGMKEALQWKIKHINNIGPTTEGRQNVNPNYDEDHDVRAEHQCIRIPQNWKMGESIGSGEFGTVYKVLDAGTQYEQFAFKQIAFSISKETLKVNSKKHEVI